MKTFLNETSSFPTKWTSADGRTLHLDLVFSGDDSFSVRQATLVLTEDTMQIIGGAK